MIVLVQKLVTCNPFDFPRPVAAVVKIVNIKHHAPLPTCKNLQQGTLAKAFLMSHAWTVFILDSTTSEERQDKNFKCLSSAFPQRVSKRYWKNWGQHVIIEFSQKNHLEKSGNLNISEAKMLKILPSIHLKSGTSEIQPQGPSQKKR